MDENDEELKDCVIDFCSNEFLISTKGATNNINGHRRDKYDPLIH